MLLSVNHNFLGSEGLQGTHIDALNQFSSKFMTLTQRGGLLTFLVNLALCAACARVRRARVCAGILAARRARSTALAWFVQKAVVQQQNKATGWYQATAGAYCILVNGGCTVEIAKGCGVLVHIEFSCHVKTDDLQRA